MPKRATESKDAFEEGESGSINNAAHQEINDYEENNLNYEDDYGDLIEFDVDQIQNNLKIEDENKARLKNAQGKLEKEFENRARFLPKGPRWAERNRSTVTLSLRVSPQLLEAINVASSGNRLDWMKSVILRQLQVGGGEPPEFPDYKSTDKINVRLKPDLIQQIDQVRGAVPRAEWIKRVAYWASHSARVLEPAASL